MNHEIELKLRLNPSELPLLEQALAADQFIVEPSLQLLNRYFDTPQMDLSQGGAALRIRQQGRLDTKGNVEETRIIQTLKTRGTSAGGLHQRMEWDWPLIEVALDPRLIQESEAQQHLSKDIDLANIDALFTTDFKRRVWLYKQDDTIIEMVLDQGQVSTVEHSIDLLELELELLQGDAEVLFQLAQGLAQQCPMLMSDISKAERGYGLLALSNEFQGIKKDWQGQVPSIDPCLDVIATFKLFFSYQLSAWQRSLELSIWDGKDFPPESIALQIEQLQNLMALFSSIDCLPEVQLLQRQLNQAIQTKQEVSLIWGQLTLACGHWLYQLANDNASFVISPEEHNALQLHRELIK
jgi:inorganic triphosphatase YgiF